MLHHVAKAHGLLHGPGLILLFGQEAVIVFFLLSGFVIFNGEHRRALRPGGYYARRVRRIYPVLIAAMIVSTLVATDNGDLAARFDWRSLWGTLAGLQDIAAIKPGVIVDPYLDNLPLWSLSYELAFYLVFPPILMLWQRHPRATDHAVGIGCCLCYGLYALHPNHAALVGAYFMIWWSGAMAARAYLAGGTRHSRDRRRPLVAGGVRPVCRTGRGDRREQGLRRLSHAAIPPHGRRAGDAVRVFRPGRGRDRPAQHGACPALRVSGVDLLRIICLSLPAARRLATGGRLALVPGGADPAGRGFPWCGNDRSTAASTIAPVDSLPDRPYLQRPLLLQIIEPLMPIDPSLTFIPVSIAVLTVSDTRGPADDRSGDTLVDRLTAAGHRLAERAIERDDGDAIVARLSRWIADPESIASSPPAAPG